MEQSEDPESVESAKRSLLAKSKRAIVVRSPDGNTEYFCVECPLKFTEIIKMENHLQMHSNEYRFLCGICGTALKRKEHLDRHTLEHQEVRPHICPECGKAFKRKEHLNIHRTIHSGEKNHVCPLCDKSFYRKDHLQKHLQTHINRQGEPELDEREEMLEIKEEVMDDQPVITDVTGYDSELLIELRDALSRVKQPEMEPQVDPERPYACLHCNKTYKRKDHLKLHSVSHMAKDKICLECGKAFRKDDQLRNHMNIHMKPCVTLEEGDPYPVLIEQEEPDSSDSLLVERPGGPAPRALPGSPGARPHECAQCGRRFKRKQHLKVHASVHARHYRPNIWCSVCSEGFFNNVQFEGHECMGAPGEEPPAPPPQCANQENDFPNEQMVQILNEPIVPEDPASIPKPRRVFVCRFCSKPFKRKDHYRIHLHVHTGVKTFYCPHCNKGFYRKDHLQKHSQVHLKEKPKISIQKAKKALPELFPIHMLQKKEVTVKPEITITAPPNSALRVPLQMKVPYQVVTLQPGGRPRAVTVDPARTMRDLLS